MSEGITLDHLPADAPRIGLELRWQNQSIDDGVTPARLAVNLSYYQSVRRAGGRPILLPPLREDALDLLPELDALLLTGGMDVLPARYGQRPHPQTDTMTPQQDASVFELLTRVEDLAIPTLGICLGCQEMNVHRGGTLHQHLPDAFPDSKVQHSIPKGTAWHSLRVEPGRLSAILEKIPEQVTSRHHQAVDRVGSRLAAVAWAPDGVIEAVEDPRLPFYVGVQWHCEDMGSDEPTRRLFAAFISAAREYARKK